MTPRKKILLAAIFAFLVMAFAANFNRIRTFLSGSSAEVQSSVLDAANGPEPVDGTVDVKDVENASIIRSHE